MTDEAKEGCPTDLSAASAAAANRAGCKMFIGSTREAFCVVEVDDMVIGTEGIDRMFSCQYEMR